MQTSETRILSTHGGSLPRSDALLAALTGASALDEEQFDALVAADTDAVVRRQLESGIDVGSDGELPRIAFHMYVKDRMSGFGGRSARGTFSDIAKFPKWAALAMGAAPAEEAADDDNLTQTADAPAAVGELHYDEELRAARRELDSFEASLARQRAAGTFAETFVTAASPGIVSTTMTRDPANPFYADDEAYVLAIAEEIKREYEHIVARGHVLQIDAPDLAMERSLSFQHDSLESFLDRAELHVEAINRAVRDIPPDRVRLHACWGNYAGPHVDDVDLEHVLPLLYRAKVGAIYIPAGNPRQQHNWRAFERHPLPDEMSLVVGVIDVTTNYVEHPQVVADRLCDFAAAIGDPHRLMAGTDCGFGTIAGYVLVAEDVVWPKLAALSEGARIAGERLFR